MKIKVNNELLVSAAKKVGLKGTDATIQFEIMPKQEGKDFNIISVKGCDGHFMVATYIVGKAAIKEPQSMFLPGFFADTVLKMAQYYKDDFTMTVEEGKDMILSCGSAEVPIPVLPSGKMIPSCNPRKEACIPIKVDRAEFQDAVAKGTAASSTDGSGNILDGAACLYLKKDADANKLCIMSLYSGQAMASSAYVTVKETNASFASEAVTIDAAQLSAVCASLTKDDIVIYVFDKQIIVEDSQTFYTFVIKTRGKFPVEKLEMMLKKPEEYGFSVKIPVNAFLGGMSVSELNLGGKKYPLRIFMEGNTLTLRKERNTAKLESAQVDGEIDLYVATEMVRKLLSKFRADSESLELIGTTDQAPIYLGMGEETASQALIMPVNVAVYGKDEESSEQ